MFFVLVHNTTQKQKKNTIKGVKKLLTVHTYIHWGMHVLLCFNVCLYISAWDTFNRFEVAGVWLSARLFRCRRGHTHTQPSGAYVGGAARRCQRRCCCFKNNIIYFRFLLLLFLFSECAIIKDTLLFTTMYNYWLRNSVSCQLIAHNNFFHYEIYLSLVFYLYFAASLRHFDECSCN